MSDYKIRQIWEHSYDAFRSSGQYLSHVQHKASLAILNCKSGRLGCSVSRCSDCGHMEFHNLSCRNRSCPNCQAVLKEVWVDKRRAEVIDSPYFHVVFTLPHELNPLIYRNQELDYHVHIHCIISGGGITPDHKLRKSKGRFFIPVKVLRDKFKGKYLACLSSYYECGKLSFPSSCKDLRNSYHWKEWKNRLYEKDWCPYIKETFNGFGNVIECLGRCTHKIAISNSRILSVSPTESTFVARGKKPGEPKREITLRNTEFIRRFLMHVLPSGFQKIRYYGFLNNRMKVKNLRVIFTLQGHQRFKRRYTDLSIAELLKAVWNFDLCICPECGHATMKQLGRSYIPSNLKLLEKIQSPYTLLAAFPRTWYNREESHLEQLESFSGCSFLIALNMILHLRFIPFFPFVTETFIYTVIAMYQLQINQLQ